MYACIRTTDIVVYCPLPRVSLSDWGRVLRKRQLDDVHRQRPEFNAKYYWDARMHLVDDYVSQEMPVARFRLYGSPCLDVGQTVPVPVTMPPLPLVGWWHKKFPCLAPSQSRRWVGKGQRSGRDV